MQNCSSRELTGRCNATTGIQAETIIQSGNLVPDSMILDLISSELWKRGWLSTSNSSSSTDSTKSNSSLSHQNPVPPPQSPAKISPDASFILDGFPRTLSQALSLDSLVPINFAVHLVTPPSVILSRIAKRWVHEPSGRVYNTDFNAPKVPGRDDVTGEPLTQRSDDSTDTWYQRYHKFEETSRDLVAHYADKGCLSRIEGNSSDEITPRLFKAIEERFC